MVSSNCGTVEIVGRCGFVHVGTHIQIFQSVHMCVRRHPTIANVALRKQFQRLMEYIGDSKLHSVRRGEGVVVGVVKARVCLSGCG